MAKQNMLAIQILSDLHLESPRAYDVFQITPHAPYLALLGDIGQVKDDGLIAFIKQAMKHFDTVFFVPGNHEAYGLSWNETRARLERLECKKFVLLDRRAHTMDGVTILGCSLFSRVPAADAMAVEAGLQDFFQTSSWSVEKHNEAHDRDLAWLNAQVMQHDKIVVLTHWSPTTDPRAIDQRHAGSVISSGFATDLSTEACCTSEKVVLWAFGHTHFNCDYVVDRETAPLRFLANQRGYYFRQADGFDAGKVVIVK